MAEDDNKKESSLDSDKSFGSGLNEIGWQLGGRRILLEPGPLRPGLRRRSVTPPGDGEE